MNPTAILMPMMALVALTFAVLGLIPYQRFKAGMAGRITPQDFEFGESANVPGEVRIPNRNMMNLLEIPALFYLFCITCYITGHVDALAVWLSWLYVALRVVHSGVHLSYNRVQHRLVFFAVSNLVLMVAWVRLSLQLI
jgi:hypothetical protein